MRFLPLVALLTLSATPILAQSEPVATRPTSPPVLVLDSAEIVVTQQGAPRQPSCWRARRICSAYFLTDIGVEFPVWYSNHPDPLAGGGEARDFRIRPVWTIGLMGSSGRHSHGGAASLVGEHAAGGMPFMLEYRYRNWIGEAAALDVGVGYKQNGFVAPPRGVQPGKGITAMIAWTPNRWIGISARSDIMRAASRDRRALLLGVQSTRLSEETFKFVLVTTVRLLLEKIGVDTSNEEQ